jgi:Subtilase family/FlgD Ig-like domain/Kre9/KNH-like N-terminal Ig-like domain
MRSTVSFLGSALVVVSSLSPALVAASVDEEVIVYFRRAVVELPSSGASVAPEGLASCSSEMQSVFVARNVDLIWQAVPSFALADTVMITPEGTIVQMPDLSQLFVLHSPASQVEGLVSDLTASSDVVFAERNGVGVERSIVPNDPDFHRQWAVNPNSDDTVSPAADIKVLNAWDNSQGSGSVSIGFVDPGGIAWPDHPDLVGRVSGETNANVSDHATSVAGIAAAKGNNGLGVAGVDWNCGVVTRKFGSYSELVDDMYALRDAGVEIINHSWGQADDVFLLTVGWVFAMTYKANILNVVSMPETSSPYNYPNLYNAGGLDVAATSNDATKASYSSTNSLVDLAAPGGDGTGSAAVFSTVTQPSGDPYGYVSGTSVSAPHVSGAAALLKAYDSSLYNDDIANLLRFSADDVNALFKPGFDDDIGWGRLNVQKAFSLLQPPYSLVRPTANGGYSYQTLPQGVMMFIGFGASPADGYYATTAVEVRRSITFSALYALPPRVWGRGVETVGYLLENPNYTLGWCEAVPGTITKSGCTLRTWVFDLYTLDATPEHIGFKPTDPANVRFAYSINGIRDLAPPSTQVLSPNGGESFPAGSATTIQWHVGDEYFPGVHCTIFLDLETSGGTSVWIVAENQPVDQNGDGSYNWTIPGGMPGDSAYKIRVVAFDTNEHQGIDSSNNYFTIQPWSGKGGPPPPPPPCQAPCAPIRTMTYLTDLLPVSPNPFNPQTRIRFTLRNADEITLRIYDVHGGLVTTVVEGIQSQGLHEVLWDGRDGSGQRLPSGVYFVALNADQRVFTQKLVMLK